LFTTHELFQWLRIRTTWVTHFGSADDNGQSLAALFDTNVATEVKLRVDRRPA
jgi:hypothetical protein